MAFIIYNNAMHPDVGLRGEIEQIYNGTSTAAADCVLAYQSLLEGEADPENDYIDLPTLEVRQKTKLDLALSKSEIQADGLDETVLSGLPVPVTVYVNNAPVTVDDGTLELTASSPGYIRILLRQAAYEAERITVHAI